MSDRDLTRETGRPRPRLLDVAVVAVLLLVLVGYYLTPTAAAAPRGLSGPGPLAYLLVTLAALLLLVWRRWPVAVFGAVAVLAAVQLALGHAFGPIMLQVILATGMVTWRRRGRVLVWLGVGYGLLLAVAFTVRCLRFSLDPVQMLLHWPASALLWIALPAAVGTALRARREAAVRLGLERSRRAASEEQLRLAQELHDVVGHGLAVIAMQAGSGQHVLDRDPERARLALQAIEETARGSLDGLRAEIGSLRPQSGHVGPAPDRPDSAPSPTVPLRPHEGIADLPSLVERIRRGGPAVVLELDPAVDHHVVPAEVDHAAYRIVQESLTNVLRHAGGRAVAHVLVRADPGPSLVVQVTDTGPRHPGGHPDGDQGGSVAGMGIAGMRARARHAGGCVEAGPQEDGGFRVTAHLPLPAPAGQGRP